MKDYSEEYKDPRWQKKRLKIFNRDKFTCQECGDNSNTLHVHHKQYKDGKKVWEYPMIDLVTLCETCHKLKHPTLMDKIKVLIKDIGTYHRQIQRRTGGAQHYCRGHGRGNGHD